jgi:predicted DNA-binding transcriptional regulator AlpA
MTGANGARSDHLPDERSTAILASTERQDAPKDRLLDPDEVALRWGVTRAHVYRLAREKKLPKGVVVELGRYYRFRLRGLQAFEEAGGTGEQAG